MSTQLFRLLPKFVVRLVFILAFVVQSQWRSLAEEVFSVPPARSLPVVDGNIDENEWRDALSVYGALDTQGNFEPRPTVFYLVYSPEQLFFAVKSELPPDGQLVTQGRQDGKDVLGDDEWEVWLHPLIPGKETSACSYQMVGNALGFKFNTIWENRGMGWKPLDWNPKWEYKSSLKDGWWMAEAGISLSEIGISSKTNDWRLRFNLCRGFKNPHAYASLAGARSYADVDLMALLIPDEQAPAIQLRKTDELALKDMKIGLEMRNLGKKAISVKVIGDTTRPDGRSDHKEEVIKISAESKTMSTILQDIPFQDEIGVLFKVMSEDAAKSYFVHRIKFRPSREKRWADQNVSRLSALYLPSFNKLELIYNAKPLIDKGIKVSAVNVSVKSDKAQKEIVKREIKEINQYDEAEATIELPPLDVGTYRVEALVMPAGSDGKPDTAVFEKKAPFEWEGNNLGVSDEIIPPFTPLEVTKNTVKVILRELEMNRLGLWEKVKSRGQDILTDPMTLVMESDGKSQTWTLGMLKTIEENKGRAVFESESENEVCTLKTTSVLEYDGFMKVELRMIPKGSNQVDRMSLRMAMPDQEAYLMHAVNEMCRSCPAGNIPEGQGRVWDNRLVPSLSKNKFVPYVWIGGEERGICWMADDEKDWIMDPKKPSLEIVREKEKVILQVNFINKKAVLGRERKLVFGLMATPVKPMPEKWRTWDWMFFGSGRCWGTETFSDAFPKDRDFSIFAGLKKTVENGEIDNEMMARWMDKFYSDTEFDAIRKKGIEEVFGWVKQYSPNWKSWKNNCGVMLYMDPSHVSTALRESEYFKGEWRIRPFRTSYTDLGIVCYMVQPTSRSYQDYLLYYYNRLLDTDFVKILYFDEISFSIFQSYNPVFGKGYINDDGEKVGSRSLFELRDFIKRVAMLYHQRKMYPRIILHITNQMLIPCYSFANMVLDWEDKYDSPNSFLRRFPDDFVRAETIGLQAGCVPLTLGGLTGPTNKFTKAQLERSYWGMNFLHGLNNPHGPLARKDQVLIDYGYRDDDCEFVPYWKKSPLIKADKDTVKISFYRKKDSLLIIAVNYSGATDYSLSIDLQALGLPATVKAVDAETKGAIEASAPGRWKVSIPKEDYRLVLVKTDG